MAKIIHFTGITYLDIEPQRMLERAMEADLEGVVVMGYKKNGNHYFASSYADGGTVLWLIEQLKKELLDIQL